MDAPVFEAYLNAPSQVPPTELLDGHPPAAGDGRVSLAPAPASGSPRPLGRWPPAVRMRLMEVRELIFATAAVTPGVGPLAEIAEVGRAGLPHHGGEPQRQHRPPRARRRRPTRRRAVQLPHDTRRQLSRALCRCAGLRRQSGDPARRFSPLPTSALSLCPSDGADLSSTGRARRRARSSADAPGRRLRAVRDPPAATRPPRSRRSPPAPGCTSWTPRRGERDPLGEAVRQVGVGDEGTAERNGVGLALIQRACALAAS